MLGVSIPHDASESGEVSWEPMSRANLVTALAANRRSEANAVGALAAMMMVQSARLALMWMRSGVRCLDRYRSHMVQDSAA